MEVHAAVNEDLHTLSAVEESVGLLSDVEDAMDGLSPTENEPALDQDDSAYATSDCATDSGWFEDAWSDDGDGCPGLVQDEDEDEETPLRPRARDSEAHTGRRQKWDRQTAENKRTLEGLAEKLRVQYDDIIKMRESEPPTIRRILEHAHAINHLPPPADDVIAALDAHEDTRRMLIELHLDPLQFLPEHHPAVLVPCPDPFDDDLAPSLRVDADDRDGHLYMLFRVVANALARKNLDHYDATYTADAHRSVARRKEMERHLTMGICI